MDRLEQIKETLKQVQRAQASNWGYNYYRDVSWLIEWHEKRDSLCPWCLATKVDKKCPNECDDE